MNEVWLSESIFSWPIKVEKGVVADPRKAGHAYELLNHAEQLLNESGRPSSVRDSEAFLDLRRAVHHRLELIEHCYQLSGLFPSTTGPIARLEAVGLAKPVLTQHLKTLIDEVESGEPPTPDTARIQALLEVAWYFLKATDPVCKVIRTSVAFEQNFALDTNTPPLKFHAEIAPLHTQQLRIFGWFSSNHFRLEPEDGYPMKMLVAYTKERLQGAAHARPIVLSEQGPSLAPDRWLDGIVEPGPKRILQFWKTNFAQ